MPPGGEDNQHAEASRVRLRHGLCVVRHSSRAGPVHAPIRPCSGACGAALGYGSGQLSAQDASAIAEKLQNPVGDLISVPFQNNTNFNVGPHKGTQDILNIQPVIPIHVTPNWNIITRTILPLVWSPSYQPAQSVPPFGLAPITFSAFLSPKNPVHGWVLGRRSDRRVADHHKPDARFECLGRRPGIRGRAARQPLGFRGTG